MAKNRSKRREREEGESNSNSNSNLNSNENESPKKKRRVLMDAREYRKIWLSVIKRPKPTEEKVIESPAKKSKEVLKEASISKGPEPLLHVVNLEINMEDEINSCLFCNAPPTGDLLFCEGKDCNKRCHVACLDPSRKKILPAGAWFCVPCVQKKMQFGVHAVSKGLESIWDVKQGKEYFVKYKSLAHVHNKWLSEAEILQEAPQIISEFNSIISKEKAKTWKNEWTHPQRILKTRALMSGKTAEDFFANNKTLRFCNEEWLVKWSGLGYEQATWELESSSFFIEGKNMLSELELRRQLAKDISDPAFLMKALEVKENPLIKLDRLPDGSPAGMNNDCLISINKIREFWHGSKNALLIDNQERVTKTILFISSVIKDVCRPILIISNETSIPLWESKFRFLAPCINVVTYTGTKTVREFIQDIEFYEEGRCIMFQVLLSHPDAILEDFEKLEFVGWEAVIIDECKSSEMSKKLDKFKNLSTDFSLLLSCSPLNDDISEHMNMLSYLDPFNTCVKYITNKTQALEILKKTLKTRTLYMEKSNYEDELFKDRMKLIETVYERRKGVILQKQKKDATHIEKYKEREKTKRKNNLSNVIENFERLKMCEFDDHVKFQYKRLEEFYIGVRNKEQKDKDEWIEKAKLGDLDESFDRLSFDFRFCIEQFNWDGLNEEIVETRNEKERNEEKEKKETGNDKTVNVEMENEETGNNKAENVEMRNVEMGNEETRNEEEMINEETGNSKMGNVEIGNGEMGDKETGNDKTENVEMRNVETGNEETLIANTEDMMNEETGNANVELTGQNRASNEKETDAMESAQLTEPVTTEPAVKETFTVCETNNELVVNENTMNTDIKKEQIQMVKESEVNTASTIIDLVEETGVNTAPTLIDLVEETCNDSQIVKNHVGNENMRNVNDETQIMQCEVVEPVNEETVNNQETVNNEEISEEMLIDGEKGDGDILPDAPINQEAANQEDNASPMEINLVIETINGQEIINVNMENEGGMIEMETPVDHCEMVIEETVNQETVIEETVNEITVEETVNQETVVEETVNEITVEETVNNEEIAIEETVNNEETTMEEMVNNEEIGVKESENNEKIGAEETVNNEEIVVEETENNEETAVEKTVNNEEMVNSEETVNNEEIETGQMVNEGTVIEGAILIEETVNNGAQRDVNIFHGVPIDQQETEPTIAQVQIPYRNVNMPAGTTSDPHQQSGSVVYTNPIMTQPPFQIPNPNLTAGATSDPIHQSDSAVYTNPIMTQRPLPSQINTPASATSANRQFDSAVCTNPIMSQPTFQTEINVPAGATSDPNRQTSNAFNQSFLSPDPLRNELMNIKQKDDALFRSYQQKMIKQKAEFEEQMAKIRKEHEDLERETELEFQTQKKWISDVLQKLRANLALAEQFRAVYIRQSSFSSFEGRSQTPRPVQPRQPYQQQTLNPNQMSRQFPSHSFSVPSPSFLSPVEMGIFVNSPSSSQGTPNLSHIPLMRPSHSHSQPTGDLQSIPSPNPSLYYRLSTGDQYQFSPSVRTGLFRPAGADPATSAQAGAELAVGSQRVSISASQSQHLRNVLRIRAQVSGSAMGSGINVGNVDWRNVIGNFGNDGRFGGNDRNGGSNDRNGG